MNPFLYLRNVWPWSVDDWSPDWSPDEPEPGDADQSTADRAQAAVEAARPGERVVYPVVNVEDRAATVKYKNGKTKRTRYRPVNLRKRKVIVGMHQAGVERGEARWGKSVHRVTCSRAVGPTGTRYKVHPLTTRLVCTNRFDRKPWHCIGIEQLGNMEGVEGSGRWYKPEVFGYGTLSKPEEMGLMQEIESIKDEVEAMGAELYGIAPHRVSGKGRNGKPNRQLCCGSAIWSRVGERAAVEFGLRVPGEYQSFGGLTIPENWHGPHWDEVQARGLVGL